MTDNEGENNQETMPEEFFFVFFAFLDILSLSVLAACSLTRPK